MRGSVLAFVLATTVAPAVPLHADPVALSAAGSLKTALGELAADDQAAYGLPVETTFAPSGLLGERIEQGEPAQVFASARIKHSLALAGDGRGGPVALFARNELCAKAHAVPAE